MLAKGGWVLRQPTKLDIRLLRGASSWCTLLGDWFKRPQTQNLFPTTGRPLAMITAIIDNSILLSNLEVQRNSDSVLKEKELKETAWSLRAAKEALRDMVADVGRRAWGELSPKQVTALWISAASAIGTVGLGLDWGTKWLLLPLAAAIFRAPSDHRALVLALCFAVILLGVELFILKGTQIKGGVTPPPSDANDMCLSRVCVSCRSRQGTDGR